MKLAELHWPEIKNLNKTKTLVLIPLGSMEQHGPHLPFQVDAFISAFRCQKEFFFRLIPGSSDTTQKSLTGR